MCYSIVRAYITDDIPVLEIREEFPVFPSSFEMISEEELPALKVSVTAPVDGMFEVNWGVRDYVSYDDLYILNRNCSKEWFLRLYQDEGFTAAVAARWAELRNGISTSITGTIQVP